MEQTEPRQSGISRSDIHQLITGHPIDYRERQRRTLAGSLIPQAKKRGNPPRADGEEAPWSDVMLRADILFGESTWGSLKVVLYIVWALLMASAIWAPIHTVGQTRRQERLIASWPKVQATVTGKAGVTTATRLTIPAMETKVVDTIGAGDSYMSALILGLLSRGTDGLAPSLPEQLGRTAAMAAAITVGRRGANPPTEEELRCRFLKQQPVQYN